jgi:hypothetical protein
MSGCPLVQTTESRKAGLDRRGRSAVCWGLALFVAFHLAYYPLSNFWPHLYDGEYGHKFAGLRAQLAAGPPGRPCVVMLGSSMTGLGFDPSSLESVRPGSAGGPVVYNFAINSCGVVVQLLCLRRLLSEGIRPDCVLLEAHPWFLLRRYNQHADVHYFPVQRLCQEDLAVIARFDPRAGELLGDWEGRRWQPWFSHRQNLQNYFLPSWVDRKKREELWWYFTDRNGWEQLPHAMARARGLAPGVLEASIRYHVKVLNSQPVDDTFLRVYRELIDTCRQFKITAALVRMPETRVMREGLSPAARRRIDAAYTGLGSQTGVPVLDGRAWVADEDLFDGFHMTPRGAATFSRELERQFLGPHVFRRRN